ncbi:4Fe-4S dicluster domain-containing protein [Acidobacteriota bacterium]
MVSIKISDKTYDPQFVKKLEEISGQNFHQCMQCGTCSGACPMEEQMDTSPRKIMLLSHWGLKEKVTDTNTVWLCATCNTCYARCPRGIELPKLMEAIRQLALRDNENYKEPFEIPDEVMEELPQIALVSCFRKHTS